MKSHTIIFITLILLAAQPAGAGPLRDRLEESRAAHVETMDADENSNSSAPLPKGVRYLKDICYGNNSQQCFDVYTPDTARSAPVILMVHGGAWRWGDKASRTVVEKKIARWLPRGFIFISVNYRLMPAADPLKQAEDVARALAAAQARALSWGGDPSKFILMGHSAGAHLVALLDASPSRALNLGANPWLGAILLDSAALNVVQIMESKHFRFYDSAFGGQQTYWKSVSPFHILSSPIPPILAVCSTRRADSCSQARSFTDKARSLGATAKMLEQNLSHRDINEKLGINNTYTLSVEQFMGSLDPSVLNLLTSPSPRQQR